MQKQLKIATRSSALAMAQTNYIIGELKQECEIIKVSNEICDVICNIHYIKCPLQVFLQNKQNNIYLSKRQMLQFILQRIYLLQQILNCIQLHIQNLNKRGDVVLLNNKYNYKVWVNYQMHLRLVHYHLEEFQQLKIDILNQIQQILQEIQIHVSQNQMKDTMMQSFQQKLVFQDQVWLIEFLLIQKRKSSFMRRHKQPQEFNAERMIRIQQKDYKFQMIQIHKRDAQLKECSQIYQKEDADYQLQEDGYVYIKGRVLAVDSTKVIEDEAIDHFEKVGQILCDKIKVLGGIELIESLKQQK
ncbi:unnamed protein product [Paramecium pentaurelia]|uniref:Uncharacterized protein n=1 Tax=Paramecium pentaurelia TaxID=43138 RepID=A0A8S1VM79_9CILI|nr:unnamed protein product [Paramecium pentaurelia]